MRKLGKTRARVAALVLFAALAVGGAVALSPRSPHSRPGRAFARGHGPRAGARPVPFRREGRGNEAERKGAGPAAEQVGDRAYPRAYVDDRRAVASRRAFRAARAPARAASSGGARAAAVVLRSGWRELGPFVPLVPPEVSYTGAATTQSGRVTAMAIAPSCAPGNCRLWVAAAGGGIWRTPDGLAGKPAWTPVDSGLPTGSFGSLVEDPNDPSGNTLYAGSGEPNGSADSEAGLGLFKTTDGGDHWQSVAGSVPVALNRSVGTIAIQPGQSQTIYIGTDLARHGLSENSGGRRTPPGAPALGLYKSTDGGAHFSLVLSRPGSATPPSSGADWFQGGVNKVELDPSDPSIVYAAVVGYGIWRSDPVHDADAAYRQVFVTRNPGDAFGDRTEFALTVKSGLTRIYAGDGSDDQSVADFWRIDDAGHPASQLAAANANVGWTKLSDPNPGTPGFSSYTYCQNGQCGYDDVVAVEPGQPDKVWLGGSMNYDELPGGAHEGRSNGRALVRSTDAGVNFRDATNDATDPPTGMHPDQHAIVFDPANPDIAWAASDGGVVRTDGAYDNHSSDCAFRPLTAVEFADCQRFLNGIPHRILSLNDGLRDLQFQGLSFDPSSPTRHLMGGTQDNGTFAYDGSPSWVETVGGDGGASAFDAHRSATRIHTYYSGDLDVNFHGTEPTNWDSISEPLVGSGENVAFFFPVRADPVVSGTLFAGLQHVWRTQDDGGSPAALDQHCSILHGPDGSMTCGDWQPVGPDLTSGAFGDRAGDHVVALERAPGDRATLWAATRTGRLFISRNADASPGRVGFRRLDSHSTPGRFVSGISVDPGNPNRAWVSYSGYDAYTPTTHGHVFEVTYDPARHRATFRDRSYNLGDQPIADVARDAVTGDLYAATDYGVLRLPAHTAHWQNAAGGLPAVAVYELRLSTRSHVVYAATHGRGAFVLGLPTAPRGTIVGPTRTRAGAGG
ncbi:MAG: hypothetical protein QOK31_164, partial [Solirubrobacteraceae bacterium]|nr:hypothetical protein [Solirubrobacteraceae bacterium]